MEVCDDLANRSCEIRKSERRANLKKAKGVSVEQIKRKQK
jgi:hypothetical protein